MARRAPSGLKLTLNTLSVCPCSKADCFPDAASRLAPFRLGRRWPGAAVRAETDIRHDVRVPFQEGQSLAGGGVPDRAVPSWEPMARRVPSGLKLTLCTRAGTKTALSTGAVCHRSKVNCLPEAASQTAPCRLRRRWPGACRPGCNSRSSRRSCALAARSTACPRRRPRPEPSSLRRRWPYGSHPD